tara:strand:+ start:1388 stop:2095 length:708 start_codon:yes stop_codon:yes gene_type:complete
VYLTYFILSQLGINLNNNDVLRRLRYTFNYNDKKMAAIFLSAGITVTREQVSRWLKKDNDTDYLCCQDVDLASFLNGFINDKRGKKEGSQALPEKRLTNNIILTKLKIALNLKAEELIELLDSVGFSLNKAELSAFSRKVEHKHYRECKDQVLRNLLQAIDKKYHVARTEKLEKTPPANNNYKSKVQHKHKAKNKLTDQYVEGARPNASAIYNNPANNSNNSEPARKVLKLKSKK